MPHGLDQFDYNGVLLGSRRLVYTTREDETSLVGLILFLNPYRVTMKSTATL